MFDSSLIMINNTEEYYTRLKNIREGNYDYRKKIQEIKNPLEIHHMHAKHIPSYLEATTKAQKGEIYCWLCASPHIVKNGHKDKSRDDNFSFNCRDCNSVFSYTMDKKTYDAFSGFKVMKKGQKKKFY